MSKTIKMKEPSVVRTYDADGFRRRASCICVNKDETQVLLVTSRKDASQWIVPGGGVEPDEAAASAAVREVREEAGVSGELGRCLGVFENAERKHRTSVYVLVVTEELDDWDESHTFGRQRRWFSVEAAVRALYKPLQSNYVKLLLPPDHLYHTQPPHPHIPPVFPHPDTPAAAESSRKQPHHLSSNQPDEPAKTESSAQLLSTDAHDIVDNVGSVNNSVDVNDGEAVTDECCVIDGNGTDADAVDGSVNDEVPPFVDVLGSATECASVVASSQVATSVLENLCDRPPGVLPPQDCKDHCNIVASSGAASMTASISTG